MLAAERRALVLRLLGRDGVAPLADIARLAGASEATVRRDLARLAAEGLVERVHGGAVAPGPAGGSGGFFDLLRKIVG